MQTDPKAKSKRPGARKRKPKVKKYPRKRCDNCPKYYEKKKPNQRFCCPHCKDEFHNNRSGFGKLKETMPRFMRAAADEALLEMRAEVLELEARLATKIEALSAAIKPILVEREEAASQPNAE